MERRLELMFEIEQTNGNENRSLGNSSANPGAGVKGALGTVLIWGTPEGVLGCYGPTQEHIS